MTQTKLFDAQLVIPVSNQTWAKLEALALMFSENKAILGRRGISKAIIELEASLTDEQRTIYQQNVEKLLKRKELKNAIKNDAPSPADQ